VDRGGARDGGRVDRRGRLGRAPVERRAKLVETVAALLLLAGFLAGLAQALICAARPSWRLLPMPDAVADRLRALPLLLAAGGVRDLAGRPADNRAEHRPWR